MEQARNTLIHWRFQAEWPLPVEKASSGGRSWAFGCCASTHLSKRQHYAHVNRAPLAQMPSSWCKWRFAQQQKGAAGASQWGLWSQRLSCFKSAARKMWMHDYASIFFIITLEWVVVVGFKALIFLPEVVNHWIGRGTSVSCLVRLFGGRSLFEIFVSFAFWVRYL